MIILLGQGIGCNDERQILVECQIQGSAPIWPIIPLWQLKWVSLLSGMLDMQNLDNVFLYAINDTVIPENKISYLEIIEPVFICDRTAIREIF